MFKVSTRPYAPSRALRAVDRGIARAPERDRRLKRLRFILPLALVLAALALPAPVAAADPTNAAGRPISGGYDPNIGGGNCQGIAYGRVAGALVLFVPHHCRYGKECSGCLNSMDRSGMVVYGANGTRIGTWGPLSTPSATHDLTFIYIDAASKPTYANRIYRGPDPAASDWWTLTAQPTSTTSGCDGNWSADAAWQMAQDQEDLDWIYYNRQGSLMNFLVSKGSGLTRYCAIRTGLYVRNLCSCPSDVVESGSPVIREDYQTRLFGYMTLSYSCLYDCLAVTPIYEGIHALADWYGGDTRLCITAAC